MNSEQAQSVKNTTYNSLKYVIQQINNKNKQTLV